MSPTEFSAVEALLATLVHDLRQPLSNIENTTYWLSSLAESCDLRVKEQLRMIERQVEHAERLLAEASSELSRLHAQRQDEAMSMDFMNSTRAGLT